MASQSCYKKLYIWQSYYASHFIIIYTLSRYIHYIIYIIWYGHKCYDIIDGTLVIWTPDRTSNFRDKILEKILKILIQSLPCIFAERNKGYQIGEKFVIKDYGDSHVDFQVKTTIFQETKTKYISWNYHH